MRDAENGRHFVFPKWMNLLLPFAVVTAIAAPHYFGALVPLVAAPSTLVEGYQPKQPIAFSHETHVGQVGMDCRYCHTTVEENAFAAIPPTQTCMNCHHAIQTKDPDVVKIREAYESGEPIEWVKVHDLPDYAYFNHAVHVNSGVSCVECHGRIDRMGEEGVRLVNDLSMGWCIECHREPEDSIRPRGQVFNLDWNPADATEAEKEEVENIIAHLKTDRQRTDCSVCHR